MPKVLRLRQPLSQLLQLLLKYQNCNQVQQQQLLHHQKEMILVSKKRPHS